MNDYSDYDNYGYDDLEQEYYENSDPINTVTERFYCNYDYDTQNTFEMQLRSIPSIYQ